MASGRSGGGGSAPPPVEEEDYPSNYIPGSTYVPPAPQYVATDAGTYAGAGAGAPPPPPPAASTYYGGPTPEDQQIRGPAQLPNYVVTSYPASGAPDTRRMIPPAGSTYPNPEKAIFPTPEEDAERLAQAHKAGAYPDLKPRYSGEGPLGGGPPPAHYRYFPSDELSNLYHGYAAGEGAMGRGDPLSPYNQNVQYGRPIINYRPLPGNPSAYTRYRKGTFNGLLPGQQPHPLPGVDPPPPGYVPEVIKRHGHSINTYWAEREGTEPEVLSPQPGTPYPSTPSMPLPQGNATLLEVLAAMEQRRRERRQGLAGLFGGGS